ncbi:methylmalonyl-CoA mutase subunit beta [Flagellimonas sp. HMM57]|uniref:methylmalonyl-CoA mutase subunit beta n=1 Tax=unclassified Flagellimonas TaxID=2644544 RepID=UPI0013D8A9EF|nr:MULTISPECIES: methylmalonyl-CoA mutase subunit beta [unclassified Flagellimonas]UII75291.1 methylmalonyl-CoA mutase subunit beta [Flagellimonas sp. HMM57]
MIKEDLFSEFPEVSAKQWKQKIQVDLKGADYTKTLVWESLEGVKVKPFYSVEDLEGLKTFKLPNDHHWSVAQSIYAGDSKKANTKAITSIAKGTESILFTIPNDNVDFEILFSNIDLESIPIHLEFQFLDSVIVRKLLVFLNGKKATIHLNFDIIGNLSRTGNWFHNLEEDHTLLENIYNLALKNGNISSIAVDTSLYQNSGANAVQQLAYGLAHANEYLNYFQNNDLTKAEKSQPIIFKVSVSGNYFFEIAKLRALRWLWKSISETYDISDDCHILAIPSKRNKTLYDYNVNMLRTTSEYMSAILGGADTVLSLPYDAIYHKDNEFAERIARNQLLLLKEESYFDQASKVAEGSYYVEVLTHQLAEKALELFKQIENSGGFLNELKKGNIQRKVKESAAKEEQLFEKKQTTLVGTNKFENLDDKMKDSLDLYPFVKIKPRKTIIEPIVEKRLAEALEQKRLSDE